MRVSSGLLVIALVSAICGLPACAADAVDLLLVLAADVSRSIDAPKFELQRTGYSTAFTNPRVLNAITSGPNGRIAICFTEWSGIGAQKVVVDWMVVGDAASGREFGDKILEAARSFADRTSISGGIEFAMTEFDRAPMTAGRRVIDISGDGTNNAGREVTAARDEALAKGVTINGLVILSDKPNAWNADHTNPPGGLASYYRENVIGGPAAFVLVAENFNSFGDALINKLVAEIASVHAPRYAGNQR